MAVKFPHCSCRGNAVADRRRRWKEQASVECPGRSRSLACSLHKSIAALVGTLQASRKLEEL